MVKLFELFPIELKQDIIKSKLKIENNNIEYAFPIQHKLPLTSVRNVQSAIAQLFKVKRVSHSEVMQAYKKIVEKADKFKICTMGLKKEYEQYLDNAQKSRKN